MFTTRRRSKRKILILMASFAAAIVAVFGVCGIILGQTKADMSKLSSQTIENTLTSESEVVTVEISDNSFVGGSFVFEQQSNVVIRNCEFEDVGVSVWGQNVQFLESSVDGGSCSIGGETAFVDDCQFQDVSEGVMIGGNVIICDSSIENSGIKIENAVAILLGKTNVSGIGISVNNGGLAIGYDEDVENEIMDMGFGEIELKQCSGSISGCTDAVVLDNFSVFRMCSGLIENNTGIGVKALNACNISMHGNGVIQNNGSHGVYLKDDGYHIWGDYGESISSNGYESTFYFSGGLISNNGNEEIDGGGVYVGAFCVFSMIEDSGNCSPSIENNKAKNGGGIYCARFAKFEKMYGAGLTGNTASASGGGMYLYSANSIQINSSVIEKNVAKNGGGIYCPFESYALVDRSGVSITSNSGFALKDNIASENGGGIYLGDRSYLSLEGDYINVENNSSSNSGGAIYASDSCSVNINGGVFTKNHSGVGGVIYSRHGSVNIYGGVFGHSQTSLGNYANGGGVVFITNGTFKMTGGSMEYNSANGNGGGIYFGSSNVATLSGGTISNNYASSNGGGVFVAYSNSTETVTLSGATISNNIATDGGGVYVSRADSSRLGTFVVSSGSISDNIAYGHGGGIYSNGRLTVSGGSIVSNETTGNGGGIYFESSNVATLSGGTISSNSATNGGGVYSNVSLTVDGGSLILNEATSNGGGIYSKGSLTVQGGNIGNVSVTWNSGNYVINSDQGNTAGNDGGGIYAQADVNLKAGAKIRGNNATNGGGIFASSTLNTDGGFVDYNEASASGGGVYALNISSNNTSGNFEVDFNKANNGAGMIVFGGTIGKNVRVRGNIASNNGGGIHFVGANATINGFGGSIYIGQENYGEYSFENTAKQGGGIFAGTNNGVGADIKMYNVNIINNKATDNGGGLTVYKAKAVFGEGTKISLNHVSVQSGVAYGGGVVVDDCEHTVFAAGSEVSQNYIEKTGSSILNYSYAGGAGVYVTGESTKCYLQSNMDNANPAKFEANYISAGFDYSAGGNIYINSNVAKFSMQEVLITGVKGSDGALKKQATIGGGIFIYTPELGEIYDDPSKVAEIKVDIHGGIFKDCLADYGGAIASIGSFKLRTTIIDYDGDKIGDTYTRVEFDNCQVSDGGVGSAIFTAGMLAIGEGFYSIGFEEGDDIAIASNEAGGTYKKDSYNSIFKTNIPNRTGSIHLLSSMSSPVYLNFCNFEVNSITQKITVNPNSMSNIESHYFKENQPKDDSNGYGSKLLVTGNFYNYSNFNLTLYYVLPTGLYWAIPFKAFHNELMARCISDKEQIFIEYDEWMFSLDKDTARIRYDEGLSSNTYYRCEFSDASGDYGYDSLYTSAIVDVDNALTCTYLKSNDGSSIKISDGFVAGSEYNLLQIMGENIDKKYFKLKFDYS